MQSVLSQQGLVADCDFVVERKFALDQEIACFGDRPLGG